MPPLSPPPSIIIIIIIIIVVVVIIIAIIVATAYEAKFELVQGLDPGPGQLRDSII